MRYKGKDVTKKINFVFESRSTLDPIEDYRSSKFFDYLEHIKAELPFSSNIVVVNNFTDVHFLKRDEVYVFVLPFVRPYIERAGTKHNVQHLHALQDAYTQQNVIILADYSHESSIPGPWKNAVREDGEGFAQWLECERYVLSTLGMTGYDNIDWHYPFKAVVPTFNFMSATLFEMMDYHKPGNAQPLPNIRKANNFNSRPYRYLILNRLARTHRLEFLLECHNKDILEKAIWNLQCPPGSDFSCGELAEFTDIYGTEPKYLQEPWTEWSKTMHQYIPVNLLDQCEIYIGTDTFNDFYYNTADNITNKPIDSNKPMVYHDISEKSIKGFLYGMPTFINNRPGTIKRLEQCGFWLPGDYDSIQDNRSRMRKLIDDAESFVLLPEHEEALENNRQIIMDKQFHYNESKELFDTFLHLTNA